MPRREEGRRSGPLMAGANPRRRTRKIRNESGSVSSEHSAGITVAVGYRFSVDLRTLERASAGVNQVLSEIGETNITQLPAGADVSGNGGLADVLGDFCSRWQRGLQNLATEGQQTADRLGYAVHAYASYEEATRQATAEGAAVSSGPGATG